MSLTAGVRGILRIFEILLENKHMKPTDTQQASTADADICAEKRTMSGQGNLADLSLRATHLWGTKRRIPFTRMQFWMSIVSDVEVIDLSAELTPKRLTPEMMTQTQPAPAPAPDDDEADDHDSVEIIGFQIWNGPDKPMTVLPVPPGTEFVLRTPRATGKTTLAPETITVGRSVGKSWVDTQPAPAAVEVNAPDRDRCLRLADMEGDQTIGAGLTPPAERPTPITDAVVRELRENAASKVTARDTMTGLACNLERQLSEARDGWRDEIVKAQADMRRVEAQINRLRERLDEARKQRDMLAEALEKIASGAHDWKTCVDQIAPQAIAAVKETTNSQAQPPQVG